MGTSPGGTTRQFCLLGVCNVGQIGVFKSDTFSVGFQKKYGSLGPTKAIYDVFRGGTVGSTPQSQKAPQWQDILMKKPTKVPPGGQTDRQTDILLQRSCEGFTCEVHPKLLGCGSSIKSTSVVHLKIHHKFLQMKKTHKYR